MILNDVLTQRMQTMTETDLTSKSTVGALVVENPLRAKVFEKFGIDYCCGGKRNLEEVCRERGIDPTIVTIALKECDQRAQTLPPQECTNRLESASISDLIDHILTTHHVFLRDELPRLLQLARKVADVHSSEHPELKQLAVLFAGFKCELEMHMMKEEHVLFPFMKQLETATTAPSFHCGYISNPISVMEHEHEQAGMMLREFREITNDYLLPPAACNSYRSLFAGLEELERDLIQHVHEENNILFPKAMESEKRFLH